MKSILASLVILGLALCGCSEPTKSTPAANGSPAKPNAAVELPKQTSPGTGTEVALTPENTKIEFVGTHSGDKPDPRKGSFARFAGKATVEGDALKAVNVEIDTESLTTENDKLTTHLKSNDFFDVKQHPKAKFVSTAIEPAGDGKVNITGDLTLLEATKSISFPATVSTKDGLSLKSEFQIDRTEFGMTYGEGKVEKQVAMTITVGK